MPNQNKFDLSSFAPAEGDEILVESTPRKKEGRFDLSLFPESARPKVQPSVPESPYDDSALAMAKRIGSNVVQRLVNIPAGLQTTIGAGVRFAERLEDDPVLAQQRKAETQEALKASGYVDPIPGLKKSVTELQEGPLKAKPGTPVTTANLRKASLGDKAKLLARGTTEAVSGTAVNMGMTLLNPVIGTAAIFFSEVEDTKANLEELEKQGIKIDPAYKDLAMVGGAAFKTALEKAGLESLMSKAPGVRGKVFNTLNAMLTESKTEGAQALTDVLLEAGTKVSADDAAEIFQTFKSEIEKNSGRIEESVILGGLAGGAIRGGVEVARIPGERAQAKKEAQAKSLADTEEEGRLADEAKTTRENLRVKSERESLLDRLQKERDLETGGPLVGADETGFRRPEIIDQAIQKRLSEIPEEDIPRDPELRKLLDEKKLITQFQPSQFDLADFKPAEAPLEKPVVPVSERETRAQTPGIADAKSFNSALDDFLKIENETKGKPLSEQMSIAKQRLEEKGYHPAIVDELASPERLKRPDLEGDLVEATTREGRIKRAVEPPPGLKDKINLVSKRVVAFRDAEAQYLQARKDIFSEVEKLGGKIIAQGDNGTFKIEIKPGKAKLSLQDQLALVKLRQEAAEAGAYSLATVGKGFEIAAAPLRIKSGETLKGDLNQKVSEFISRKNAFQTAKRGADGAKKALLDSYTDFYFKNKTEGKTNSSLIGKAGDIPVEVQLRRKASSPVPDMAVIDPTTGKTWAERLRDERKEAQKRSEALGPQGEPFVETRKIGEAKSEELQAQKVPFFDIRGNLSETDQIKWDAVQKRSAESFAKASANELVDPAMWKDLAETGYYVSKALGRASKGRAIEFAEWSNQMVKQFGEKIGAALEKLWSELQAGKWAKAGDELDAYVVNQNSGANLPLEHIRLVDKIHVLTRGAFEQAHSGKVLGFAQGKTIYLPEGFNNETFAHELGHAVHKSLESTARASLEIQISKTRVFKQLLETSRFRHDVEGLTNELIANSYAYNLGFKNTDPWRNHEIPIVTDAINKAFPRAESQSFFDFRKFLNNLELQALDAAQQRLDIASREFVSQGLRGQIAPTISPKIWKEYVEIGHFVAKGLARNLGEKAKITFENFKEAFKNAVGEGLFKRLEGHLATLWDQVKALPDDWKSGDEVPTITRAELVENTPEPSPSNISKAERRFDFGLPLIDRLERSNQVGGEIGRAWRKAHGILKTALGRNAVKIREIAKEAGRNRDKTTPHLDVVSRQPGWQKKGANLLLVDLINNPERMKDYPLTDVEKKILKLWRDTYEAQENELARRVGREPRPLHFTPTLNNEAREAIFVLKGGPLFEAMAKATAERSGVELKKVKQKFASGNLSGLDIPTHVNLKGNLVAVGSADALSALQAQNFEFARTLGLLRTFGPKWKTEIKNLRERYDKSGGDLEVFDLIEQGYRGLKPKDWVSQKQASRSLAARLYFRAADPVLSALALSKSAYMQITQPFIDLQNVGAKNYMNTIRDAFKGKLSADDLERMGIISRDVLNWKFTEGEKIEDYGRMISGLVNRGDLMHAVSLLNDVASASNWRNFVNSLEGKKLTAKDKQTLRTNLGLTDAEIQKVEQGKFKDPLGENPTTPEEEFFVEMVRRGKTQSQHTGKFGGEKSKFQTGSTSPFFLRFQNYTIGEFQRWRRETSNLERALKSGDKDERNAAIGRVFKLVGTTVVQGELINIIRHTIKGEWDEWEESSGVAQALRGHPWQSAKNFMWNFAEAGFMGAFTRAYFAYQIAQGSATALMDAFFPTNILHNAWDAIFSRGRYADKDKSERILEFLESRIPATDLSKPLERAMALTALAKEDHIAIDAARRHYFKWLEDTGRAGEFPEKSGYKESRASVARAYAALKRGDDEHVLEALATAFQAKLEEGTPNKKKLSQGEALDLVKKSLKARMLLSRHKRVDLEELEKTIGEERFKRLAHHDALLKHLANSLSISKLRSQKEE